MEFLLGRELLERARVSPILSRAKNIKISVARLNISEILLTWNINPYRAMKADDYYVGKIFKTCSSYDEKINTVDPGETAHFVSSGSTVFVN